MNCSISVDSCYVRLEEFPRRKRHGSFYFPYRAPAPPLTLHDRAACIPPTTPRLSLGGTRGGEVGNPFPWRIRTTFYPDSSEDVSFKILDETRYSFWA